MPFRGAAMDFSPGDSVSRAGHLDDVSPRIGIRPTCDDPTKRNVADRNLRREGQGFQEQLQLGQLGAEAGRPRGIV